MKWDVDVAHHDYEAAFKYLTLRLPDADAERVVGRLRNARLVTRRVNDILRACRLEPLPLTDPGVGHGLAKVLRGERLSPVLVVVIDGLADVADGYHRLSLAYNLNPFGDVPMCLAVHERTT